MEISKKKTTRHAKREENEKSTNHKTYILKFCRQAYQVEHKLEISIRE
jgi:hypothetical protein